LARQGRISKCTYLGARQRVVVAFDGGEEVHASVLGRRDIGDIGDAVFVSAEPDSGCLVPADE
jgi:hypothetical protein